jgi:iron complex outermembrane receptor protein
VLRDGASSTYGTDAIAGVVNIITKKQIRGLHLDASAGMAEHNGNAKEFKIAGAYGIGDYANQGFNVYVGGEFQRNNQLLARDTYYPYNTSNLSRICAPSIGGGTDGFGNPVTAGQTTCDFNGISNGVNADGAFNGPGPFGGADGIGSTRVPFVAPIAMPASGLVGTSANQPVGPYQMLNPAAGCQGLTSLTLNAAQAAQSGVAGVAPTDGVVCQEDYTKEYGQLQPKQTRYGLSARASIRVSDSAQAYVMANWYRNQVFAYAAPISTRSSSFRTAAGGTQVDLRNLVLPVYICPRTTVGDCTAANGTLNPNDPFASQGLGARLLWAAPVPATTTTTANTYRVAAGLSGDLAGTWHYNVDAVGMKIDARSDYTGSYNIQHVLDVVKDGSFNFVDPSANTQAQWDYLMPEDIVNSTSKMYQLQASLAHNFLTLPGGDLGVAVGASLRHEEVNWVSANPINTANPADRHDRLINGVGASGARTVKSVYGEIDAPILNMLEIDASGRYDSYSSGQNAFSPKIGAKFKPIPQFTLRGTWSKGFRVPSFNEAFGLPTTGFVGDTVTASRDGGAAYLAAHGNDAYATQAYTYGLTSTGNPNLKPEKSRNITIGAIFQPIRPLTFTVDFYDIKIKNLIGAPDTSSVLDLYYGNNGVVNLPGITVIKGAPDPSFPNALPRLDEIQYSFVNSGSFTTRGLDFSAEARIHLGNVRWTSYAEATRILKLRASNQPFDYQGTLSPCNVTSCSGAPAWRGSWQNTFDLGKLTVTGTAYYTSGYDEASVDFGGTPGDCLASLGASVGIFADGVTPILCRQKSFVTFDATANYKLLPGVQLYVNVLNVFNRKAPFDPGAAYGLFGYNPAYHEAGILGRYYRVGLKIDFDPKPHVEALPPAPPPPPAAPPPATQTCADGSVILATAACPVVPPPPPPPPPAATKGERG